MSASRIAERWVDSTAAMTQPARTVWCDGSKAEYDSLIEAMLQDGTLLPLDASAYPNCYLHRSHPSDVARTEQLTFICTAERDDAGPTNNWMSPADAKARAGNYFRGAMRGRTMYVIPYLMGPVGSTMSRVGIMVTDSAYVVASMHIMTRVGPVALAAMRRDDDFIAGVHSLGDLSPDHRLILHFPEEKLIWSVGSGYGGNALLGKKCHALRIASVQARDEGWLAEHMLILGITNPEGRKAYMAAAFPSACGKTNLAMMNPTLPGWRVETIGDDIAWMKFGADGRLHAINPEAGFFGVAPGTSMRSNPNALRTCRENSIFTNCAITPDGDVWWEEMTEAPPPELVDWLRRPWAPGNGRTAAHPNARFTTPARQCPVISPEWENPKGVPISAILFGGRRAGVVPLVNEALDWRHGTFLGSIMSSETTAAAAGAVGRLRFDPFAMLPFCGYHMGDYFAHWLRIGASADPAQLPRIYHVNWFRKDPDGRFLWPGYGDNSRVLKWIFERTEGTGKAVETPIGRLPAPGALDLSGLRIPDSSMAELLRVDVEGWMAELPAIKSHLARFEPRLPQGLREDLAALEQRLQKAAVAAGR